MSGGETGGGGFRRCWMIKNVMSKAISPTAAMPPITPPMMAATGALPVPADAGGEGVGEVLVCAVVVWVEDEDEEVDVVIPALVTPGGEASSVSRPPREAHWKMEKTLPGEAVVECTRV
jgi:hypothetical protein